MDVTIKYKDAVIAEMSSSGQKTLTTGGKYCDGNIVVQYDDPEKPTQEKTIEPSETAQEVTPDSGKVLSKVSVGAIPQTYVGSKVPKKSEQTYTPKTYDQTIAADQYLSGDQTIKGDANLVAENIKSGVSLFGVTGTHEGRKDEQSKTVTPTAAGFTVSPDSGKVLSSVVVSGDANLSAENVREGISIFGVTGALKEGIMPSGTKSITENGTYDVAEFASAQVSVPSQYDYVRRWEVTVPSVQTETFTFVSGDPWVAKHYADETFAVAFYITSAIGTPAENSLTMGINGNIKQCIYGIGHGTNASGSVIRQSMTFSSLSSAGVTATIGANSNGDIKFGARDTSALQPGTYIVVAMR